MAQNKADQLAGLAYSGLAGISRSCKHAVMRLLQFGDQVTHARILTCSNVHCLLLTVSAGDLVAVKSGFGSGYRGEGASAFSYVLQLLDAHGVDIEEHEVTQDVVKRLDGSSLTISDLHKLDESYPVRPSRWTDYIFENHRDLSQTGELWRSFPPVVPLAVIDPRITDLAISFWENPDDRLLTAYRRLEDIVRKRTGLDQHGSKLFAQTFTGDTAKLEWRDLDRGEQSGRAQLFTAVYMAHRNPRAHRELKENDTAQLGEFLLLNQLFVLENQATERRDSELPESD